MYLHQTKEAKKKIVLQYLKGLKLKGRIIKIGESLISIKKGTGGLQELMGDIDRVEGESIWISAMSGRPKEIIGQVSHIGESLTDILLDMGEGVKKGITIRIDPYPHMYQIGIVMEGIEHRICGTDPLTGKEALIDILDKEDEIHTCMEETHNW